MPPSVETPISKEKQFELAEKFLQLSEEVGRMVDELRRMVPKESKVEFDRISLDIRNTIFRRTCDIAMIAEQARTWAVDGEVTEDDPASREV